MLALWGLRRFCPSWSLEVTHGFNLWKLSHCLLFDFCLSTFLKISFFWNWDPLWSETARLYINLSFDFNLNCSILDISQVMDLRVMCGDHILMNLVYCFLVVLLFYSFFFKATSRVFLPSRGSVINGVTYYLLRACLDMFCSSGFPHPCKDVFSPSCAVLLHVLYFIDISA